VAAGADLAARTGEGADALQTVILELGRTVREFRIERESRTGQRVWSERPQDAGNETDGRDAGRGDDMMHSAALFLPAQMAGFGR
jgi:methyl-accepting chemotaxis protein